MRHYFFITVWIFVTVSARADWTKVDANTTANLWGVCYGGGRYVAVGTGGTILTSPDATKWTPRTSGTAEWLTAVAYGNNLYVAVGDHGVILTSPDTVTWTSRGNSGPRFNGIAFGGDRFLAVGEAGTVCASTDAIAWTTRTLPVNTWLRGVCFGQDGFLLGSGAGDLASTRDGLVFRLRDRQESSVESVFYAEGETLIAGTFIAGNAGHLPMLGESGTTPRAGTPGIMRAVTRSQNLLLGVGTQGLLIRRVFHSTGNYLPNEQLGSENLNAVVSSSAMTVVVGDGGTIFVEPQTGAESPAGATISASSTTVFPGGAVRLVVSANGSWPFTYQWFHNGMAIPDAKKDNLDIENAATSSDGKYSVTVANALGSTSADINLTAADASSSALADARFVADSPGYLVPATDGRLLCVTNLLGHPEQTVFKINEDGSWDLSFRADISGSLIIPLADGSVLGGGAPFQKFTSSGSQDSTFIPINNFWVIPLANGKILSISISGNSATIKRYSSEGVADAAYPGVSLSLKTNDVSNWAPVWTRDSRDRVLLSFSKARYYGVGANSGEVSGSDETWLYRLNADGELDSEFTPVYLTEAIAELKSPVEKIYYRAVREYDALKFETKVARLNGNGSYDTQYSPLVLPYDPYSPNTQLATLGNDGSVYSVAGDLFERYSPVGRVDWRTHLVVGGSIWRIIPLYDGRVLLQGAFSSVNGVLTSGAARLSMVTHDPATYLANLSIRTTAGSGDQTLIAGFVVAGEGGTRSVLARGVGPGLVPLGLKASEVVPDPQLKFFRAQSVVASNDNWDSSLEATANALGAYPLARDSKDAALFTALLPGAYTAHVTSTTGAAGVALVELYDAGGVPTSASSPRLVNLSGRARVGTGDNVLIAGFVLSGMNAKRLLIRAVGPGLRAQGVNDALADPQLTIFRGADAIATNDDWNSADLPVFKQVGAFDLASGSKDAALVADLVPGVYTAVVRGANNTTGTALVEIYEVP